MVFEGERRLKKVGKKVHPQTKSWLRLCQSVSQSVILNMQPSGTDLAV